jgi:metal-responsive CopG/Arc/MetJ family transcriptional regulator
VYTCGMKPTDEKQMVHMRLDLPLLKRLDDFRFKYRFESRSEAARWLMKLALDQKPSPKSEGKV